MGNSCNRACFANRYFETLSVRALPNRCDSRNIDWHNDGNSYELFREEKISGTVATLINPQRIFDFCKPRLDKLITGFDCLGMGFFYVCTKHFERIKSVFGKPGVFRGGHRV